MGKKYRVILFVLLVAGVIFNFGQTVHAENTIEWPVAFDETNFPDEAFRNYLKNKYGFDGEITEAEMQNVTEIDISYNKNITSLKGVEYFQNLETLYCYNTDISELDVSKNTNLVNLYCHKTGISELDVSKNTSLVTLNCYNTKISILDVTKNTKLLKLNCSYTRISSLDVSNTTVVLTCHNCVSPVTLSNGNTIELSQLPGFDASKMSNIQNATLSEGKLIVEDPLKMVSYTYNLGKSGRATFYLEISSYEIKYDANGGTGQMESLITKGELATLPENEFVAPSGKQFKEWSVKSTSGDKVKAGETYTFTEAITVYAVWENKPIAIDKTNFPDEEFRNYLLGDRKSTRLNSSH